MGWNDTSAVVIISGQLFEKLPKNSSQLHES